MARIERLGEREMRATTAVTGRVSHRWLSALSDVDVRILRGLSSDSGSDDNLRTLFAALEDERSSLMAASAELRQDQLALALQNRRLREMASLLERVEQILTSSGSVDRDVQSATRQRSKDLLEQATNAANAHAAIRRMIRGNDEVIRALRAAGNAVLLALRGSPTARAPLRTHIDDIETQRRKALGAAT